MYAVAKEAGISAITIQSWLSKLKDGSLDLHYEGTEPTPAQRSAGEKFKLLLESKNRDEEE